MRLPIAHFRIPVALCLAAWIAGALVAEEPSVSYIFPAGGQRGTTVNFRVGGHFLHGEANFEMLGPGVVATPRVRETNTVWFEGPVIPLPASQQAENYPRDHAGSVRIANDAPMGARHWRVWTSQGATPSMKFIIGDLPEVVEQEMDGAPVPVEVRPPVTINGRIFPREDVDVWTFNARAGEEFTVSVAALALGSPLQARLVVHDPSGRQLAEAIPARGADPQLRFKAATAGVHSVRVHDVSFGGLQHYVYRLTITSQPVVARVFPLGGRRGASVKLELDGAALPARSATLKIPSDAPANIVVPLELAGSKLGPVLLETDDLPEFVHGGGATSFTTPAVLNGRVGSPGSTNTWNFAAKKGDSFELSLAAPRLGSPLAAVVTVSDTAGNQLARAEANPADVTDLNLAFKAPDEGGFTVRVSERFLSRGGPEFAYRLRVGPTAAPDFQLTLASDAINVIRELPEGFVPPAKAKANPRQKPGQLRVNVAAMAGFAGEIELGVDGLPAGVTVSNTKIAARKPTHDLSFAVEPKTKIGVHRVVIRGTATIQGQRVTRTASLQLKRGEPSQESVLLAVAMPTPFKHAGDYLFTLGPRGSVFHRPYRLERGGFSGPLTVRLADRQGRHLQGVTGGDLIVPPDADSFEYTVSLPPWMEIGRTSRSQLMVSGMLKDDDGTEHIVSYTSNEQNDQVIVVISGGLLGVEADRHSITATPAAPAELKVRVQREPSIAGLLVRVELALPAHVRGVKCKPVVVPAGREEAVLVVTCAAGAGPFTLPAVVRAATIGPGDPHFAETRLELVGP